MVGVAAACGLLVLILVQLSVEGEGLGGETTYSSVTRLRVVEADVGVVAANHVLCWDIGVGILKKGGNAIDVGIATAFCQEVANPRTSGIGGGDFMLARLANGLAEAMDLRETAPLRIIEFLPDVVNYENYTTMRGEIVQLPPTTQQFLKDRGHVLTSSSSGCISQFIVLDLTTPVNVVGKAPKNNKVFLGKLTTVSDLRKDGYPSGY